jgi:hypothetical protein
MSFGRSDYHSYLKWMANNPNAPVLTEKEWNDLQLFDQIRINEEILRNKMKIQELESMKKEYDI